MKLLHELTKQPSFLKKDDSGMTEEMMKEIQKTIRNGAEDKDQKWANALELVHKSYDDIGQPYPSPDEKSAWKQYEDNISYAVSQLAKSRGLQGDWRMSSSIFRESESEDKLFKVKYIHGLRVSETWTIKAKSIEDLSNMVREAREKAKREKELRIHVKPVGDKFHINFWKHGVKLSDYIEVTPHTTL